MPETVPTDIPTILEVGRLFAGAVDEDIAAAVVDAGRAVVGVVTDAEVNADDIGVGEPVAVVRGTVNGTDVVGAVIVLGTLLIDDLLLDVLAEDWDVMVALEESVGTGATKTALPEVNSVATSVACVFGNAPLSPSHMPNALCTTVVLPSSPPTPVFEHPPASSSPIIHSTAPSPIVYPLVEFCEHRVSRSGEIPRREMLKFTSRKEMKHGCAHVGMKFVNWLER